VIPAGIAFGIGESWAWTAMPIITTSFAEKYSARAPQKLERYTRYHTGCFYSAFQAAVVSTNCFICIKMHFGLILIA